MKKRDSLQTRDVDCRCCATGERASAAGNGGCRERQAVPSAREQEVLAEIRELQERARRLKALIEAWSESDGADVLQRRREELEQLRNRRRELEAERSAAAAERMRLLGHEG